METPITQGLLITLIGMGLVFLVLLLMWLLTDAMVRIFSRGKTTATPNEAAETTALLETRDALKEHRRRAAVAAVGVALSLQTHQHTHVPFSIYSTAPSPWQLADRLNRFTPTGQTHLRNFRGAAR